MSSSNPYPVEPAGFFLGSLLACVLYGVHVSQVYTFFDTASRSTSLYHRCMVLWVVTLSTVHMLVVWTASYRYFVTGTNDLSIWGEFYWVLSVQDGTIPLMAATAQFFFGRRAWLLTGRKTWVAIFMTMMPTVTLAFGVALAITARIWSAQPWVSQEEMQSRPIGVPSQIVAIAWMGLSAITDGTLSVILCCCFFQARRASLQWSTRKIAKRLIALTLETVLLTHIVGAIMCIIFLASPKEHRTKNDLFWVLLEIITELYALSILFTIIHHETIRTTMRGDDRIGDGTMERDGHGAVFDMGQTELDRRVEGHRGAVLTTHNGSPNQYGSSHVEINLQVSDSTGSQQPSTPGTWPMTPAQELVGPNIPYFGRRDSDREEKK